MQMSAATALRGRVDECHGRVMPKWQDGFHGRIMPEWHDRPLGSHRFNDRAGPRRAAGRKPGRSISGVARVAHGRLARRDPDAWRQLRAASRASATGAIPETARIADNRI